MDLKQLFADDDAVSPVIGVILMVAITVILAAVIAALVLGLGDEPQETPQAQFEFEYDSGASEIEITHNGGQSINSENVRVIGSTSASAGSDIDSDWTSSSGSLSTGNTTTISGVDDSYEVTVLYDPGTGETSPLATDEGPSA